MWPFKKRPALTYVGPPSGCEYLPVLPFPPDSWFQEDHSKLFGEGIPSEETITSLRFKLAEAIEERDAARESIRGRDAELLRIRTTQQGAAVELEKVKYWLGVAREPEEKSVQEMVRLLVADRDAWKRRAEAAEKVAEAAEPKH